MKILVGLSMMVGYGIMAYVIARSLWGRNEPANCRMLNVLTWAGCALVILSVALMIAAVLGQTWN